MNRKETGLCAALCLGLFLTGCASGKVQQSQEDSISLTILTNGTGDYSFISQIGSRYPQIDLQIETYPEEQYYTVLKTRLATGNGPDFFFVQPGYAGSNGLEDMAKAGYILPVTEEARRLEGTEAWEHLLACKGEIYGVSGTYMMLGVSYNQAIFEEYDLTVPECWEEFLECCETLKENGVSPIAFAGAELMSYQFGIYQIAANRIYSRSPDWNEQVREGTAAFTDPGTWDDVLETFLQLYENGYINETTLMSTITEAQEALADGEAAMLFSIRPYASAEESGSGFFPLPANERGAQQYVCAADLGGLCIYSGTPYQELCKEILTELIWKGVEEQYEGFSERKEQAAYGDLPIVPFCNQGWKNDVEIVMENKLQELLVHAGITVPDITEAMQANLEK